MEGVHAVNNTGRGEYIYMNMQELSEYFHCNKQTMREWIRKEIIPGVKRENGEYKISTQYAMPPYTARRGKNATAVRNAILKAALVHRSTCAKLFGITQETYDSYVNDLQAHGLIRIETDPGFPEDKFILTTLETDKYFREKGFFGKDGMLITFTTKAWGETVQALIEVLSKR